MDVLYITIEGRHCACTPAMIMYMIWHNIQAGFRTMQCSAMALVPSDMRTISYNGNPTEAHWWFYVHKDHKHTKALTLRNTTVTNHKNPLTPSPYYHFVTSEQAHIHTWLSALTLPLHCLRREDPSSQVQPPHHFSGNHNAPAA
jgi:hypothetical protein